MIAKQFSFPPSSRLRTAAEFQQVFKNPIKSSDEYFTLLAINNQFDYSRLGLAIAKKNVKRAVDRNLIKRMIRESFRLQQQQLTAIDIVVLARRNTASVPRVVLQKSLAKHWLKLEKRCNSF